jgi:DNA-binding GntR family transcriptional regulator
MAASSIGGDFPTILSICVIDGTPQGMSIDKDFHMARTNSKTNHYLNTRKLRKGDKALVSKESDRTGRLSDERMYEAIYSAIIKHHLPPGTKLPEDALADVFGVSRTRIRKILHQLSHEGIVSLERNRGASVAKPSIQEARDVFAARHLLETAAVREIAQLSKPEDVKMLRAFVACERDAHEQRDSRAMITLSGEFHLRLVSILNNEPLTEFLKELVSRTSLVIAVYERAGASSCHYDEHEILVEHISKRDSAKAADAMRNHLVSIEESLVLEDSGTPEIKLRDVLTQGLIPQPAERRRSRSRAREGLI